MRIKIEQDLTELKGIPLKVWTAKSSSDPLSQHVVVRLVDEESMYCVCSCKGYTMTQNCWHVRKANETV